MISSISKYYLSHFIYVLLAIIYSYLIGEDSITILFYVLLSFIFSFIVYLLDLSLTILLIKLIFKRSSIFSFIIPIIILYYLFPIILNYLDFFGKLFYVQIIILVITIFINLLTWTQVKN